MNLGHLKLDDMPKFCAAYFATCGDDSIFTEPVFVDRSAEDSNGKAPLLDKHDGFALKPRKLVQQYKDNPEDSQTQGTLFVHMTNHASMQHCIASKKDHHNADLELSSGLDVEMSDQQKRMINPPLRDVALSNIINQSQEKHAKKKEAKQKH